MKCCCGCDNEGKVTHNIANIIYLFCPECYEKFTGAILIWGGAVERS